MSTPLRRPIEFRRDLLHYADDFWQDDYMPRGNPITIDDLARHYRVPRSTVASWYRRAMKKLRWMARATALAEWREK